MRRIIFLGGGGYAKEVADAVAYDNDLLLGYYALEKGLIDAEYLGKDNNVKEINKDVEYFPAIGSVCRETHSYREKILKKFEKLDINFCNILSPNSYISNKAKISYGIYVSILLKCK